MQSGKKKQHALHCARERDQWSNGVQKARDNQHLAEISRLKQQLAELASECDAAKTYRQQAEALRQQLEDITAERDAARRQVELLEASLATAGTAASPVPAIPEQVPAATLPAAVAESQSKSVPARLSYRGATAAGVVLSLGVLANVFTYQDAQSTVQTPASLQEADSASFTALETSANRTDSSRIRADAQTSPPQKPKSKTRFARTGHIELHQWGPALLPEAGAATPTGVFDPQVKRQQEGLLQLGFDIGKADGFSGPLTRQALKEFEALYLSGLEKKPTGSALAAIIKNYADLARADARSFDIDQGVLAAIRLSSVHTGIDFSYLMKLAAVESNFNPVSKSTASSAAGLYQFTRDTWLNTIRSYGEHYGLGEYVDKIDYTVDASGYQRPLVRDKAAYQHLMELRDNPRVSAMMAAESVKENVQRLTRSFDRTPSEADLYLTHFFGTDGAISFLKALDKTPDAFAVDMFPAAAQSNQDIFHPKTCKPRTVDEVYELFGQKFNTRHYELATN
jgi:Transglycosylase SLT domain/Putative peptidoglycan binding domain